jgi:hypothetical protein
MFVNVSEVKDITGYDVTGADIIRAQHIIEAFVGRNETEISGADDNALMAKAVAFQAAYMQDNYDRVYQQVAMTSFGQLDSQMALDIGMEAPFIAPLAVITLRNVSWLRSRSVKTGAMFGRARRGRWETE